MNIEFVNANVSGEMAQLMISNQERYVPAISTGHGKKEITSQVPMHGDQLFEERARNVQWTFRVGNDAFERLEGLTTEFADWHAKVTLYKVCEASATENADVSFSNPFPTPPVCLPDIIITQDLYILTD